MLEVEYFVIKSYL